MHIETPKNTIDKSAKEVYEFLTDLKNFEKLMPENIDKFEVINEDRFLFALKGMPQIVLERQEQNPHDKIVLGAASDKLPFTLTADINELNETTCEVVLSFSGEFNAMMAMMIKKPITNFMGTLSDNLVTI
ncbi:SRPBCC family protein [Maribacter sp. TH_r10]|uniref:SRPBCC family protein n=1 Tax=Maribacter luteus TaxID=2594478 RepID=A0A6I2MQX5_9FLAO|nr:MULTISPECIES: SRPBCC family protein [Maribacter]MDV7140933.1 SRPBCC family protein [Maribacter sp. TH_r10]MRX65229.1 SRPBCC family protein [Maribacter luteus]|tara:strand:+ start:2167 stop:2559 length:393 start_codon:yes stop_codon:yes gene_type:complete